MRDGAGGEKSAATTTTPKGAAPTAGTPTPATGKDGQEIARALDDVAARLDAAREGDRGDGQRLSDELQRAADLRTRLADVERSLERLSAEGQRRADAGRRDGADARGNQRAQGNGRREGEAADTAEDVAQLQRQLAEQLRETRERVEALSRDNPEMRGPATPEEWQPSVSAPGTEAFKQDFARWESLKKNLLLALERVERSATTQLRDRETRERLNAGASDAVPDDYRALVQKYYQSLAAPRRQDR